ncbi:hypothetical protein ACFX2H_012202 [Malus domestica]
MEAAGAEEVPTRVEVEAQHEDDDEEEDDDGAEHDLAAELVAVVGLHRGGVEMVGVRAAVHGWSAGKVFDNV